MNAKSRRKIEMGKRALEWSRAHPDASPGYAAAVSRLEDRLNRADQLAEQQRVGILEVRRATVRKRELRRTMKQAHLDHLASVAEVASAEDPELAEKFVLPRRVNTYLAFRTAARGLAAEAESRKELLVKHGLSETVLQGLTQSLDEFDAVVEQGTQGRAAHVGASTELDTVANEVVQVVNVMDGLNRFRFGKDGELLAAWENVSNVLAPPRSAPAKPASDGGTSASGEVRPAA
jgi:hypothetical protein